MPPANLIKNAVEKKTEEEVKVINDLFESLFEPATEEGDDKPTMAGGRGRTRTRSGRRMTDEEEERPGLRPSPRSLLNMQGPGKRLPLRKPRAAMVKEEEPLAPLVLSKAPKAHAPKTDAPATDADETKEELDVATYNGAYSAPPNTPNHPGTEADVGFAFVEDLFEDHVF